MRVAHIGASGAFGAKRLRAMVKAGAEVTALCDLKLDAVPPAYQGAGIILESDYRQLLDGDFDVAVISVPDHAKLQQVEDFLSAGKHVLVEKPLSLYTEDVRRLFSAARRHGVCLYVGYNLRFFPSVAALLDLLDTGYLGTVHHVRFFYGHGGARELLRNKNWRVGRLSWGGAFVDLGAHLLALVSRFVTGVESGVVESQHLFGADAEDSCAAVLRANGCLIELTASWTAWRSRFSAEVYGSKGFAELEGLVKYVRYGQAGERIRYGRRSASGAPEATEIAWTLRSRLQPGFVPVDDFSAETELLDQEWHWLETAFAEGTFDLDHEEASSLFVADIFERFYL